MFVGSIELPFPSIATFTGKKYGKVFSKTLREPEKNALSSFILGLGLIKFVLQGFHKVFSSLLDGFLGFRGDIRIIGHIGPFSTGPSIKKSI